MSSEEPRSPTFDGTETAEQTGQTADVSGVERERSEAGDQPTGERDEQAKRPDEAAQIVP